MRCERLLTDKDPAGRLPEFLRLWQLVVLLYTLLATLALWTLVQAPAGIQHLLLLCLLRLAVLLCVGAVSYQAQRRRRASEAPSPPFGTTTAGGSNPATPRGTLAQAALYLQVAWLASELLLGSALLVFYPHILGPLAVEGNPATATATGTLLTLLPLICAVAMSGCFLFLQRLTARRRRQRAAVPHGLECGLAGGFGTLQAAAPAGTCCSTACGAACPHHSGVDVICSPVSESGSYSSCTSASSSAAFYSRSSSSSLGGSASGGMPSPTGHVRSSGESAAQHQAAIHAACQVLLVEHQVENEYFLFVHKRLRPIKTRPEECHPSQPAGLLRELITNSFTFQHDPQLAAQLAAGIQAGAGGGSTRSPASAASLTFHAASAAGGMAAM